MCTGILGGTGLETRLLIITFAQANCRNKLVEARPDNTVDLKVSRTFASETIRNQEHVSSIEMRFLELICLNVTQYPPPRCVLTCSALCFQLFYFPRPDTGTIMEIN